jgi:hypothetical protein
VPYLSQKGLKIKSHHLMTEQNSYILCTEPSERGREGEGELRKGNLGDKI